MESKKNDEFKIYKIWSIIFLIIILDLIFEFFNGKNILYLFINNFIGMLTIYSIMLSISFISYKLFHINSLGLGDIKLSSISSIWLGIELSFISLFISFLLSSIYSIYGKIFKRFKISRE